jgi:hypothetical protein
VASNPAQSELSLAGRIGAFASWAHTPDRAARTKPGREKFLERFLDEVDPDRVLDPAERERRAESARKAYFARLALKSAQARRARKEVA